MAGVSPFRSLHRGGHSDSAQQERRPGRTLRHLRGLPPRVTPGLCRVLTGFSRGTPGYSQQELERRLRKEASAVDRDAQRKPNRRRHESLVRQLQPMPMRSRLTGGASPVPAQMWGKMSPVPAQMWEGVSPLPAETWGGMSPVPAQMCAEASPVPAQMWAGVRPVPGETTAWRWCGRGGPGATCSSVSASAGRRACASTADMRSHGATTLRTPAAGTLL
jgi:hypothetical protein